MLKIFVALLLIGVTVAFKCYTCNNKPTEDDAEPCVDRVEECAPGVTSCSTVVYQTRADDRMHTRKFCTSAGTPIYQYLLFFPGSALCQNIETVSLPPVAPAPVVRIPSSRAGVVHEIHPPAPPNQQASNLLCVCTKEKCNPGGFREVMHNNMLQNMGVEGIRLQKPTPPEFSNDVRN